MRKKCSVAMPRASVGLELIANTGGARVILCSKHPHFRRGSLPLVAPRTSGKPPSAKRLWQGTSTELPRLTAAFGLPAMHPCHVVTNALSFVTQPLCVASTSIITVTTLDSVPLLAFARFTV